jgi:hypothetical protein
MDCLILANECSTVLCNITNLSPDIPRLGILTFVFFPLICLNSQINAQRTEITIIILNLITLIPISLKEFFVALVPEHDSCLYSCHIFYMIYLLTAVG